MSKARISFDVHAHFQIISTSVPTKQNGIEWPRHYETDGNITAPYYEIIDEPKPDINFGVGLKTTECECLWKKYLLHNG